MFWAVWEVSSSSVCLKLSSFIKFCYSLFPLYFFLLVYELLICVLVFFCIGAYGLVDGFCRQGGGGGGEGWCCRASYPKLVYTPGYSCSSLEHLINVISMLCDFLSHYEGELRGGGWMWNLSLLFLMWSCMFLMLFFCSVTGHCTWLWPSDRGSSQGKCMKKVKRNVNWYKFLWARAQTKINEM